MDGDSCKKKNKINRKDSDQKEDANDLPDPSDLLQSPRVRRFICFSNEVDELILDNRLNFLFHVSPIFWLIFFIRQM